MGEHEDRVSNQKTYTPHATLAEYMAARLQFEYYDKRSSDLANKPENLKEAIQVLTKIVNSRTRKKSPDHMSDEFASDSEKLEKILDQLRITLRTGKTRILDSIIFPAMANLTYFLGTIANHRELQKVFEEDLKELFGIKRNLPMKTPYGFMLYALILSIITWSAESDREKKNFRWRIMGMMQEFIWHRSLQNLPSLFPQTSENVRKMNAHSDLQRIFMSDIDRARTWINIVSTMTEDEYDFVARETSSSKSRSKKKNDGQLYTMIKGSIPHRTFNCDPL